MESEMRKKISSLLMIMGEITHCLQVIDCRMRYEEPLTKWNEFFLA